VVFPALVIYLNFFSFSHFRNSIQFTSHGECEGTCEEEFEPLKGTTEGIKVEEEDLIKNWETP